MTNELRQTFCDIEIILNALPEEDRNKVPMKLRKFISENKLENYESEVRIDIPIEEQELSPDTRTFIGMLYLNYWCKDEEEKAEIKKVFMDNEDKKQKELDEKFEIFKKYDTNQIDNELKSEKDMQENIVETEIKTEESNMIVYKESIIRKIINKIFGIFRRKEYGK